MDLYSLLVGFIAGACSAQRAHHPAHTRIHHHAAPRSVRLIVAVLLLRGPEAARAASRDMAAAADESATSSTTGPDCPAAGKATAPAAPVKEKDAEPHGVRPKSLASAAPRSPPSPAFSPPRSSEVTDVVQTCACVHAQQALQINKPNRSHDENSHTTRKHARVHASTHTRTHASTYARTHTRSLARSFARKHADAQTRSHADTHTRVQARVKAEDNAVFGGPQGLAHRSPCLACNLHKPVIGTRSDISDGLCLVVSHRTTRGIAVDFGCTPWH